MRKAPWAAALAAVLLSASGFAVAPLAAQEPEPSRTLTPGKHSDLVTSRCATCHDAQHITRAKLSRGQWEDNVKNMIERGAPVSPDEVPLIVEYLATYYSPDGTPPPADAAPAPAAAAAGDSAQRLVTANACMACHQIAQRVVGPSFREIAAKFGGDPAAPARLARKIREGGAGVWGAVPMPPHPQISDADLRVIVGWVMEQR